MNVTLLELPQDVLGHIFQYITSSGYISLAYTSHLFRHIVSKFKPPTIYRHHEVFDAIRYDSVDLYQFIDHVNDVDVKACPYVT